MLMWVAWRGEPVGCRSRRERDVLETMTSAKTKLIRDIVFFLLFTGIAWWSLGGVLSAEFLSVVAVCAFLNVAIGVVVGLRYWLAARRDQGVERPEDRGARQRWFDRHTEATEGLRSDWLEVGIRVWIAAALGIACSVAYVLIRLVRG